MSAGVFLDTVGLIAIWDDADKWYERASLAFSELIKTGMLSFTTSFVLLECGNTAARKPYRAAVERLRAKLEEGGRVIHPTMEDWNAAWIAYRRGENADAGIVDQVSFIVMRRLGLTQAFTNDRHFQAAGFEILF